MRVWLIALLLVPLVAADHPGSINPDYSIIGTPNDQLVHHLPDVILTFTEWEAAYPEYVERMTIGETTMGFPMEGIVITDESSTANTTIGQKYVVYLDGGHHGNEFLGADLIMYYLEQLLDTRNDAEVAHFLQTTEVHAVPIINVEGNTFDTRKNARQVDPNRNYDFQWGGPGSGSSMIDFTYRGPSPASEPEVIANQAYGGSIHPELWITMHSGVAEFYWPWGWTHDPTEDDAFFSSLEEPFEQATNGAVDAMQAAELYLAAGATDDYGYGVHGVPTFTYEVHNDQFIPAYGQPIDQMLSNQLSGLDFMVKNVSKLGGFLEANHLGNQLNLTNVGWGPAWNITVTDATQTMLLDNFTGSTQFAVTGDVTVSYQTLSRNESEVRTFTAYAGQSVQDGETATPLPFVVIVAALVLALARKRN